MIIYLLINQIERCGSGLLLKKYTAKILKNGGWCAVICTRHGPEALFVQTAGPMAIDKRK